MGRNVRISDRLLNFIVDTITFTVIVFIIILVLKNFNKNFQEYNANNNRILAFTIYFSYYFFLENLFSLTIGKLLTHTRVVDITNLKRPSIIKILIRTLCRFIPFEFISIFFNDKKQMWHDILSRTTVIKEQ